MARSVTVKIEGLRELDAALGELPKSTAKAALRKVLKDAAEPVAAAARRNAPHDEYHLHESIDVSTKLSRRQRGLHKKETSPAFQEMFVGTNNPAGTQQEFGNSRHQPQPFMRPAWDGTKAGVLEHISNALWLEISKAAARVARKSFKASRGL